MSALACAAVWFVLATDAAAAPSCPDQTVRTPYMTAVTVTLACTDPLHPIVRYLPFGHPEATFTVSGDQATITPGPTISGAEAVFNYWAENAIFERTLGFLRVQVGSRPIAPPPPSPPSPPNLAPVARCDSYSVKPGEQLNVRKPGVLANDTDPEGHPLYAEAAYGSNANFPQPDINWDGSLQFQVPDKLPGGGNMLSYRYFAIDEDHRSESTVTFWVGTKDQGCRPPAEPPRESEPKSINTLSRTSGAVRIRVKGRWRSLGARHRLRRALLVDARRGSVRVRLVTKTNYTRRVTSGRFGGGLFKLGKDTKAQDGKIYSTFGTIELAGALGCPGPGRRVDVTVNGSGFLIDAIRLRAYGLSRLRGPVVSRFSVADRCNATSVVQLRRGRVGVNDHNKRGGARILTGRQTHVARSRG
jgi:hypothetical protein